MAFFKFRQGEKKCLSFLGVYCGSDTPANLPQAERFWLKFRSNSDGVAAGFSAEYTYGIASFDYVIK